VRELFLNVHAAFTQFLPADARYFLENFFEENNKTRIRGARRRPPAARADRAPFPSFEHSLTTQPTTKNSREQIASDDCGRGF